MNLLTNISNFSNPTGLEYVASVSGIFIGAVILCVAGYFATFRTKRLADFYLYCNTRNNPNNPFFDHLKRKYERRSYIRNTKIGGVWAMVWGIAMFVYFITIMFNHITPKGTTDLTVNIKSTYEALSKVDYKSFKNWHISMREGEPLYVFDCETKDSVVRFLIKRNQGKNLICHCNPDNMNDYMPIEKSLKILQATGINQNELLENVQIYFENGFNEITYNPTFDGVIIVKDNITFINLLSLEARNKVPNSYAPINDLWYYVKK